MLTIALKCSPVASETRVRLLGGRTFEENRMFEKRLVVMEYVEQEPLPFGEQQVDM